VRTQGHNRLLIGEQRARKHPNIPDVALPRWPGRVVRKGCAYSHAAERVCLWRREAESGLPWRDAAPSVIAARSGEARRVGPVGGRNGSGARAVVDGMGESGAADLGRAALDRFCGTAADRGRLPFAWRVVVTPTSLIAGAVVQAGGRRCVACCGTCA
jgi:hypothetical protein